MILEPGQYMVVPRTSGCWLKRPEKAEAEQISLLDNEGKLHPLFIATITDIFRKYDLMMEDTLN